MLLNSSVLKLQSKCPASIAALLLLNLCGSNIHAQSFIDKALDFGITAGTTNATFGSGVNFIDVNGDGFDDITVVNPNDSLRLFLSTGQGFIQAPAPVYCPAGTQQVLWVDYDNDGDLDLFVVVQGGINRLWENDGNFVFADVTLGSGMSMLPAQNYGASFGDYDNDGYLDIYVARYYLPNNINGQTNKLYKNNGDGTFSDVTDNAGVGDAIKPSFSGTWIDINNNNLADLYVINDRWPANSLFRNNGDGTFTDISESSGAALPLNDPMSNTVGDFNNDGYLDIFMSNSGSNSILPPLLLVNNGDETFTEQAVELGLDAPDITWGAVWIDFDNDGWEDLFYCTGDPTSNYLFNNISGVLFANASSQMEAPYRQSYTCASGDFNNDGYEDIIVHNLAPERPIFMENQGGSNNFIKINLTGTVSNRQATGARIRLYRGSERSYKYTLCGENFKGQDSRTVHFGLGAEASFIDSLQVTYPSGYIDTYLNLEPNATYHFIEGETFQVSIEASPPSAAFCPGDSVLLSSNQSGAHLWSTGESADSIYVTEGGEYSLTVTNAFGITAANSINIESHPDPDILVLIDNILCHGGADGAASLQNQAGANAASVIWSHGDEGTDIDSLEAGLYGFQFTDDNGCIAAGEVAISQPPQLQAAIFTEPEIAGADGSIFITPFGGTQPHQLFLNDQETGQANGGLVGGDYEIRIADFNQCQIEYVITVESLLSTRSNASKILIIFPNPTGDMFFVETDLELEYVTVLDLLGNEVMRQKDYKNRGYNVSHLNSGTYLINVENKSGEAFFGKLVKL